MARVEPDEQKRSNERQENLPRSERRERTPSQAEGDEATIDEALRHAEERRSNTDH